MLALLVGLALLVAPSSAMMRAGAPPSECNTRTVEAGTLAKDPAHLARFNGSIELIDLLQEAIVYYAAAPNEENAESVDVVLRAVESRLRTLIRIREGYMIALGMPLIDGRISGVPMPE